MRKQLKLFVLILLPLVVSGCADLALNKPPEWGAPSTSSPVGTGGVGTTPESGEQAAASRSAEAVNELVTSSRAARAEGDYAHALADIERAVRIEPRNPYLWIELGEIYLLQDDPQRAASMARKAMSIAGDDRAAKVAAESLLERASGM